MRLPPIVTARPDWLTLLLMATQSTSIVAQDVTSTDAFITTIAAASSPPSPTVLQSSISTSSWTPQTHTIQVGLLDHKVRPETTEAPVGDIIEFHFYPVNHSILRAEYSFPCIPYEMTGAGKTGFFSGFNPVDKVLDKPPKYSIRINDTEPILFYCSAPGSCITYGMVGGINLNSSMSIDKQRTLAMDSAYMLQPGEPFPAESPLPSDNPISSVLPSSSSKPTSAPATAHAPTSSLSTAAISGIIIAAVSALLFGALLFFCWGRTKPLRKAIERKDGTVRRVSASPNHMVEYKQPTVHAHHHRAHNVSQTGFQFSPHPGVHTGSHPGSPDPRLYGHGQGHQGSLGETGYSPTPAGYTAKYTSPTATRPAYHMVSSGSLPPGSSRLNEHPFTHQSAQDFSSRGTLVPGYYETFPSGQSHGQDRMAERPAEMEAITAITQVDVAENMNRASKL